MVGVVTSANLDIQAQLAAMFKAMQAKPNKNNKAMQTKFD